MSKKAANITVEDLETFADAWDRHDVDAVMAFFSDDCVFIAGWGARFEGRADVRKGVSEFFSRFPDGRFSESSHFVAGDRGVSEWTFTATGPGGEKLRMLGCDIFEFAEGKIRVRNAFRKVRLG